MLKAVGGSNVKINMTELACFLMCAYDIIYCNPYNNSVMNYYTDTNWCRGKSTIFYLIRSSAVKRRSNIVRYYISNYSNWGRISMRCLIKNTPHNGRAMVCLLWIFARKNDRVITELHCTPFTATKPHNSFGSKQTTLQQMHRAFNKACTWFSCDCLINSSPLTHGLLKSHMSVLLVEGHCCDCIMHKTTSH